MRKFDYRFLKDAPIPSEAASFLFAISRSKAASASFKITYPVVFENFTKIARIQSGSPGRRSGRNTIEINDPTWLRFKVVLLAHLSLS